MAVAQSSPDHSTVTLKSAKALQVKLEISDQRADLEFSINLTDTEAKLIDVFRTVLKEHGANIPAHQWTELLNACSDKVHFLHQFICL